MSIILYRAFVPGIVPVDPISVAVVSTIGSNFWSSTTCVVLPGGPCPDRMPPEQFAAMEAGSRRTLDGDSIVLGETQSANLAGGMLVREELRASPECEDAVRDALVADPAAREALTNFPCWEAFIDQGIAYRLAGMTPGPRR